MSKSEPKISDILGILFLLGLAAIGAFFNEDRFEKEGGYNEETTAIITKMNRTERSHTRVVYFKYTFNGSTCKRRETQVGYSLFDRLSVGDEITIQINDEMPCFEPRIVRKNQNKN